MCFKQYIITKCLNNHEFDYHLFIWIYNLKNGLHSLFMLKWMLDDFRGTLGYNNAIINSGYI